jgi:hypothetical protein
MKSTGFTLGSEEIHVGNIFAHYHGHLGYYEVVEKDDGFWLVDCSPKVFGGEWSKDQLNKSIKLDRNLEGHWTKVDNETFKEPPMIMKCDICETPTGEFDVNDGKFTWYDNCFWHEEPIEGYVFSVCHACKKAQSI